MHPPPNQPSPSYLPEGLRPHLERLGIRHLRDCLLHLPLRYIDETQERKIAELVPGEAVAVMGTVEDATFRNKPRRSFTVLLADAESAGGFAPRLTLRYFHVYPGLEAQFPLGRVVRVFGTVREGRYGLEMVHPRLVRGTTPATQASPTAHPSGQDARLTPVYPSVAAVPQKALRTLIGKALKVSEWLADPLPEAWRTQLGLPGWEEALRLLHAPPVATPQTELDSRHHPAWRRVKFDELLAQQVALSEVRKQRAGERAAMIAARGEHAARLLARLPFQLTAAQRRAVHEIRADLAKPQPMTRLLQGDVGSGKTIVAALAALDAVEAGYQVAFMAPTELLAEQHARKLVHWLAEDPELASGLVWLSGSLSTAEKRRAQLACAEGQARIVIGTHALFQKDVQFARLGLVVVDEQHRFGVAQRLSLRERSGSELMPHTLMMSATPIPRSLAMSYYADLDVSVIDQLPGGRKPIKTKLVAARRRGELIEHMREVLAGGAQAYWVCPLIEESDALEVQLRDATALTEELRAAMPGVAIELLHGKLATAEKERIMAAFIAGQVQLLVATTVIEVGVDVPNASWMVIEHAERFGLAQLHQLRGRVGRGTQASTCVLVYDEPLSETARARLKVIYENQDGFAIAREDLRIRGPGELLGPRQSGLPGLRYADIEADLELLELARRLRPKIEVTPGFRRELLLERWIGERAGYARA